MLSDRGKASATAAATSLRSSYHDLKLIFITGICDGVPGTKGEDGELALGDVVVSKSIVQYDLGRLYSDKLAIKTAAEDSLGRPSRDVRNFIAAMSTRPHRKALEKRAAAHLAQIQKEAVNRVIYEYPGSANDILFEPTYYHECHHLPKCACMDDPSQELSCEETGCDYNRQLHRQRFEDTKLPQVNQGWFVFFGRIGSGDTISMSGIYRDQIARELDIIALETGSAGAWDELPCVIVKGVSGYGDGHKNNSWNNWQNFAAATAASTTRALIERYPSTDKTHIMRNRQVYDACLKDLFITDPEADKLRIESTKGGLFEKAYNWILTNENYLQWHDNAESRLLWIKGDPGKGKTMLLCGIIDELKKDRPTRNVCQFLCQATDSRLDNATSILRGLLHTIIGRQPVLFSHMREGYEKAGKKLFEDANSWYSLSQIFLSLVNDPNLQSPIIIIDALDECRTNLSQLLDLIAKDLSSSSSKVKWLLSSRNEQDVIDRLETAKNRRAISLELNANSVSKAIEDYINHQVQALSALKEYTGASRSDPLPKPSEFPAELGSLYGRMITKVCDFRTSGQGRKILAIATVSRRPLTIKEFNSLVDTSEDHRQSLELVWSDILGYCGSFLTLRDEASAQLFPDGFGLVHTNIFKHCISAMHKTLRRNMYDLKNPGCLANQVTLDPVKSSTLTSVAYFYVYWIHHFEQSVTGPGLDTSDNTERHKVLYTFLSEKYIYWLEALSLLKSVFTGMEDLRRLKSLVIDEQLSGLKDLVQDNYRFIQMFGKVIADFPLQVYISGLLFSPPQSLTHRLFTKESPKCIQLLPPKKVNWDQYLQRFDGHTDTITSLDTSCCGTWLASSSLDETIKIWEAKTGRLIRSMKTYSFSCISFSPWNSNEIACGGLHRDEIIIWDIVTGKMLQQINAETNYIKLLSLLSSVQNVLGCVSHTKDGKSMDISFYNTKTGEMTNQAKFPLTPEKVRYLVAFSTKDSRIFAVAQKWSKIFNTHDVKLYSLNANNELQKLHCLTCPKTSAMRFSQSGHLIVVHTMSIKSTCISMFDVATGAALWRSQIVLYVSLPYLALSRDGRLALCDISKVAILDVATGKMLSTQRIELGELVFPYEQDGKHIYVASENVINVVELGSQEPSRKNPSSGHIEQLATSYQRAVLSPDERQLATFTWQPMPMIVVCDTSFQKKTCIRKHSLGASCVLKFSPDSSKLACLLRRNLRVWDVSSGSKTKTLLYHKHYCESYDYTIRFSEDGIYLAVAYTSRESLGGQKVKIQIWNVDTSQRFIYLETLKEKDESPRESFLAFSPSSKFLAISWHINKRDVKRDVTRVEVWDVTSRKGVFSKSICGGDLKSSTRIPSPLTSPSGSSQSNSWINFRGEKLLWLPPEYRPFQDSWDIQQNCILIREPYEARLFPLKFCCSGCIGRVFTPGWQPDESTLCSADAEAPVARPELSDSELEFLTMDPPDDKMMVFSSKSIADIWRIVN
ncbi:hypothetical protein M431DRAFT_479635 [Trichoderma harzianum CBS 226.95]|uniref:NACHT domain-containing protein n=1 Tax=Trichoderma harzianum CBS 226.95 TaxID=983964 RepID=A0A2T4AM05_TRIHA|nr:hypothetical protein M431DRAFT_479635 [Trichoderma harzianum CBS 226.95]PTB58116.1 hypothetical protein M431DRAFT_479635 [Trichoderma harzianum CBS 226.95]